MGKLNEILERHEINCEHPGLLENDLEEFWKSRFDQEIQSAQAEKQTLLKALQNFINPTGHTDACLELRRAGQPVCAENCQAAREAIEQVSGQKIISNKEKQQ